VKAPSTRRSSITSGSRSQAASSRSAKRVQRSSGAGSKNESSAAGDELDRWSARPLAVAGSHRRAGQHGRMDRPVIDQNPDPVRLPARGGGYTTTRYRAVSDVGDEVDEATLDEFGADAHDRDVRRRQAEAAPIVAAVDAAIAAMAPVTGLLASTRKQGVVTRDARHRARRVAHDLAELRDELPRSTT